MPSALIVHTAPSELVHVPASAAGPDVMVAQAPKSVSKAAATIIRRDDCSFMEASCGAAAEGVKLGFLANRFVAKDLIFDVERPRGTGAAGNSANAKT